MKLLFLVGEAVVALQNQRRPVFLERRPGLGIALNPRVVERYRMQDPLNIPDGSYSDMVFGRAHWNG